MVDGGGWCELELGGLAFRVNQLKGIINTWKVEVGYARHANAIHIEDVWMLGIYRTWTSAASIYRKTGSI
jgi:hypothetical protein